MCPVAAGDHGHVLRPPQVRCGPSSPAASALGCTAGGTGSRWGPAETGVLALAEGGRCPLQLCVFPSCCPPQAGLPRECQHGESRGHPKPTSFVGSCKKPTYSGIKSSAVIFLHSSGRWGECKRCGLKVSVPSERFNSLVWPLQLPRALAMCPCLAVLTALPALPQALRADALFCFVLFRWCCRTQGSPDHSGHKNFFRKLRNLPVNP